MSGNALRCPKAQGPPKDEWTNVPVQGRKGGIAPIRQPLTAQQPTEVAASPQQMQVWEDGATLPQADVGAALQGALSQMSEMTAASQKQILYLVKQMISQDVPEGAHGPGTWEVDTQARVLEAIRHQDMNCPLPSETQAPQSGRHRRQKAQPRLAPWRDPLQPTAPSPPHGPGGRS